jgi:hypothetical protein
VSLAKIDAGEQRKTNNRQQTTNNEQQATDNKQRTTINKQRSTNNKQYATVVNNCLAALGYQTEKHENIYSDTRFMAQFMELA